MSSLSCSKRSKGIEGNLRKRLSPKAISRQPRRCKDPGSTGKSTGNHGLAPTFEVHGGNITTVHLKGRGVESPKSHKRAGWSA